MKDSHLILIPSQGPQISNLCREEYCSTLSVSVKVILQSVVRVNSTAPSIILRSKVIQSARPNIVIFVSENQQVNLTTIEARKETLFELKMVKKSFFIFSFIFVASAPVNAIDSKVTNTSFTSFKLVYL
jgi:hypothetical protein